MKIKTIWLFTLIALFSALPVFAGSKTKEELVQMAVSVDSAVSAEAIKDLRTIGKDGLDALFQTYSAQITKFSQTGEATDEWKRIAFALDSVAMQKDVYASRLYWFTDLEEAKKHFNSKGIEFKGTDGSPNCLTLTDDDGNWFQLVNKDDH